MPAHTYDVNVKGLMNLCTSILSLSLIDKTKVFHASTSEMYGQVDLSLKEETLITEEHPFKPMSPYALSKISAYYMVQYYRRVYNMQICTALSFNHESPLRNEEFITRKISKGVARIKKGL